MSGASLSNDDDLLVDDESLYSNVLGKYLVKKLILVDACVVRRGASRESHHGKFNIL